MHGTLMALLASATLGIDVGWQPLDEGGLEYIIQIEPELLETFAKEGLISDVPPEARNIRRFQIVVGNAELPREEESQLASPAGAAPDLITPSVEPKTNRQPAPAPEPSDPFDYEPDGTSPNRPRSLEEPDEPAETPESAPAFPNWRSGPQPAPVERATPDRRQTDAGQRTPRTFDSSAGEHIVAYNEAAVTSPSDSAAVPAATPAPRAAQAAGEPAATTPAKPWVPFVIALLLLFGSLGGNVYLGWLNLESRSRYRALLGKVHGKPSAA